MLEPKADAFAPRDRPVGPATSTTETSLPEPALPIGREFPPRAYFRRMFRPTRPDEHGADQRSDSLFLGILQGLVTVAFWLGPSDSLHNRWMIGVHTLLTVLFLSRVIVERLPARRQRWLPRGRLTKLLIAPSLILALGFPYGHQWFTDARASCQAVATTAPARPVPNPTGIEASDAAGSAAVPDIRWRLTDPGPLALFGPLVAGDRVFVGLSAWRADGRNADLTRGLYALDLATGERLWRLPGRQNDKIAIGAGVIVIADFDGLIGVDPATGEVRWRSMRRGIVSTLTITPGAIYGQFRDGLPFSRSE